jgi:hypothetical protein
LAFLENKAGFHIPSPEREFASTKLIDDATQSPKVRAQKGFFAVENFRRDILSGPNKRIPPSLC